MRALGSASLSLYALSGAEQTPCGGDGEFELAPRILGGGEQDVKSLDLASGKERIAGPERFGNGESRLDLVGDHTTTTLGEMRVGAWIVECELGDRAW